MKSGLAALSLAGLLNLTRTSDATLLSRQINEKNALCDYWNIDTTHGSVCCPGVLQTKDGDNVAQWCCVGNNIPNATYCGDHMESYDAQTASCSTSIKIGSEGYTSSVLSVASKYTVTKAINPHVVTSKGATSTSCQTITAGVPTFTQGLSASSASTGFANPAITAQAIGGSIIMVGGLMLAL